MNTTLQGKSYFKDDPEMLIDGQVIQVLRPQHRTALWSIQKACNLSCTYCYGSFSGQAYKDMLGYKGIPLEQARNIIKGLVREGFDAIHISGGEPLLHYRFWDLISVIHSYGIRCTVTTNATILSQQDRLRLSQNHINHLMISLDTLDSSYGNKVRERHETVVKNLEWLLNERVAGRLQTKVGIYCVVSRSNIQEVADLAYWAVQKGAHPISLQPIHLPSNHPEYAALTLTEDHLSQLSDLRHILQANALLQHANPDWFWDAWFGLMKLQPNPAKARPCFAGNQLIYIDSDGKIFRCPAYNVMMDEGSIVDDVKDFKTQSPQSCDHLSFDCLCIWKLACVGF